MQDPRVSNAIIVENRFNNRILVFYIVPFCPCSCRPIASLDHFNAENLVSVDAIEEQQVGVSKCIKFSGIANQGRTVSLILRGSNKLMLEEADRSLHDALCVIKCLVKKKFLIAGGGAPGKRVFVLHRMGMLVK